LARGVSRTPLASTARWPWCALVRHMDLRIRRKPAAVDRQPNLLAKRQVWLQSTGKVTRQCYSRMGRNFTAACTAACHERLRSGVGIEPLGRPKRLANRIGAHWVGGRVVRRASGLAPLCAWGLAAWGCTGTGPHGAWGMGMGPHRGAGCFGLELRPPPPQPPAPGGVM
jgi:hypothetical protein